MAATAKIRAIWDEEADVFTTASDIPGLVVEAESYGELVELARVLAPQIIAANIGDAAIPYLVEVVARHLIIV